VALLERICTWYQDFRYAPAALAGSASWLYRFSVPRFVICGSIMNIGYARVSANHQNLDRQIALLNRAGCKQIFKEKRSGRQGIKRPQLDKAIDALSRGDVLIFAE
jgi:hypothetical protein